MPDISPTNKWVTVSPSDTVDLTLYTQRQELTDGIYVGAPGDVTLMDQSGDTATFAGVPAGTTLRVGTKRVMNTGTSAGSILALYWV